MKRIDLEVKIFGIRLIMTRAQRKVLEFWMASLRTLFTIMAFIIALFTLLRVFGRL